MQLELVEATQAIPSQTALYEQTYPSQVFPDLVPIVRKFFAEAAVSGYSTPPDRACFGIAGPVVNNTSELTNLGWSLDAKRLEKELAIASVTLINDFAAVGYGVLGLTQEDLHTLQPGKPDPNAPIAIIGAGTGLGEGFVIPQPGGDYQVFGSEGSHADFAPRSTLEFQLLNYLLEKNQLSRVSVERVVSGMGIVSIYQFLRHLDPSKESSTLKEIHSTWEQEMGTKDKTVDLAAEVSKAAMKGGDYLCEQTMKMFVEAYGSEAGNLALKLLPYGGLYIAGGITAKILPIIEDGNFIKAFISKGRVSPLVKNVPVYVVLNPKVGLIGAALCAAKMH